ncbi:glyoxalase [Saccharomonospora sp. CUA-673]|uniref:VOC family protein n=1 Tax=Saccharomonospora sp. CUA-673 TaxID=1904969 RepID=UPI00095AF4FE|nr:VOC family protein [Saccharomonospora sp. CUA-673]OLT49164.1 glyoxalase [Saccharomonospora sp. CUA-673]
MSARIREVTISLPIADRHSSMTFYRDAFGLEPFGDPAPDGMPEPLMFRLDERTVLGLIPADGLAWVLGDRQLAPTATTEYLLGLTLDAAPDVDRYLDRVAAAGGSVLATPTHQEWGYTALCADPDGHAWQLVAP